MAENFRKKKLNLIQYWEEKCKDIEKPDIVICSACHKSISTTDYPRCFGRIFHDNCFTCDRCDVTLLDRNYGTIDQKVYCLRCFAQNKNVRTKLHTNTKARPVSLYETPPLNPSLNMAKRRSSLSSPVLAALENLSFGEQSSTPSEVSFSESYHTCSSSQDYEESRRGRCKDDEPRQPRARSAAEASRRIPEDVTESSIRRRHSTAELTGRMYRLHSMSYYSKTGQMLGTGNTDGRPRSQSAAAPVVRLRNNRNSFCVDSNRYPHDQLMREMNRKYSDLSPPKQDYMTPTNKKTEKENFQVLSPTSKVMSDFPHRARGSRVTFDVPSTQPSTPKREYQGDRRASSRKDQNIIVTPRRSVRSFVLEIEDQRNR